MKKFFFLSLFFSLSLFSNPTAPMTIYGDVQYSTVGKQLIVNASDGSVINWDMFSINNDEITRFIQPSSNSSVLNQVFGGYQSKIFGRLEANGNILLVNQSGILIGDGAVISTSGFLASTLNINVKNFVNKENILCRDATHESIENLGTIQASFGNVALIAHTITNEGIIEAPNGNVNIYRAIEILLKPDFSDYIYIRPASIRKDINNSKNFTFKTELVNDENPYSKAIKIDDKMSNPSVLSLNGKFYITSKKENLK